MHTIPRRMPASRRIDALRAALVRGASGEALIAHVG